MTIGHIHVKCQRDADGKMEVLQFSITGDKIPTFRKLLGDALNINYPDKDPDFRALADILDNE